MVVGYGLGCHLSSPIKKAKKSGGNYTKAYPLTYLTFRTYL